MLNKSEIIQFYQNQLKKFRYLQNKNQHVTEHGVKITPLLIEATQRRLSELRVQRDMKWVSRIMDDSRQNGEADGI
jgi:hypothetical protein